MSSWRNWTYAEAEQALPPGAKVLPFDPTFRDRVPCHARALGVPHLYFAPPPSPPRPAFRDPRGGDAYAGIHDYC